MQVCRSAIVAQLPHIAFPKVKSLEDSSSRVPALVLELNPFVLISTSADDKDERIVKVHMPG